jgi:phage FluMu protein Com
MVMGTPLSRFASPAQLAEGLRDYRCQNPKCGRLLFQAIIEAGRVALRCRKCGHWNEFSVDKRKK